MFLMRVFNGSTYRVAGVAAILAGIALISSYAVVPYLKKEEEEHAIEEDVCKLSIDNVEATLTCEAGTPRIELKNPAICIYNESSKTLTVTRDTGFNSTEKLSLPSLKLTQILVDNFACLKVLNAETVGQLATVGVNKHSAVTLPHAVYPSLRVDCCEESSCLLSGIAIDLTIRTLNKSSINDFCAVETLNCFASRDSVVNGKSSSQCLTNLESNDESTVVIETI